MTSRAWPTGTLVNRDFTSKLTITSSLAMDSDETIPEKGDMMDVICLARRPNGDPMADTIGLRGLSTLWILEVRCFAQGRPNPVE